MYIFGYLRASTSEQDAERAKGILSDFVEQKGMRVAAWYVEQESGASLQRPKLLQLLKLIINEQYYHSHYHYTISYPLICFR